MLNIKKQIHLVQTQKWNEFKKEYGTRIEKFEDIFFLVKKIPLTNKYMGYCPKLNFEKQSINFKNLKKYCIQENISFVRFDVPNILSESKEGKKWKNKLKGICTKSPRNTFTKKNIYLNLEPEIEEILKNMHPKKRYNIRYAEKKGVNIKISQEKEGLDNFWKVHEYTSKNQGFLSHSKKYFEVMQKNLKNEMFFIQAYINTKLAVVWMLIIDNTNDTIYYPYGGSFGKYNKFYPSDLVGFEAIKLGKDHNLKLFDMWGAEEGKGFTDFKLKYGGDLVEYIPSYDFVVDSIYYNIFNFGYGLFWKIQELRKKLIKIKR